MKIALGYLWCQWTHNHRHKTNGLRHICSGCGRKWETRP